MKTITKPNAPGCCGPAADRLKTLRQVHMATTQAHTMLAGLYESFIADFPEEADDFRAAATLQKELAEKSSMATIPNAFVQQETEAAVRQAIAPATDTHGNGGAL